MHSFTTERLLIRPLSEEDKALFINLYTDAKVMRNISAPLSGEKAEKAFHNTLKIMKKAQPSIMTWVIVSLADNKAIGIQGFTWPTTNITQQGDRELTQAEIGIMLNTKANGKLFPEEAMGSLMEYGFTQLKLERINAVYASKNLATKRFVNKLGFFLPANLQNDSGKTSYQYFDYQQWKQRLIKKVFINASPKYT
ncbi:GNAT family N-acetyltransferase [Colwellia psychrerythraea]|uniref:GCN5-related N-acetyltransferase n=1 Tax=Colwellia psychrerythraea TaxID=28229 RepID=A0A099KEJ7_COLPS|nr:GNAT family N-acetyltransferase [Colwellia psychrerythraea]KGJ88447.1 GCN5-related N-acetyltransferase [Colwellia psychrerythraea]